MHGWVWPSPSSSSLRTSRGDHWIIMVVTERMKKTFKALLLTEYCIKKYSTSMTKWRDKKKLSFETVVDRLLSPIDSVIFFFKFAYPFFKRTLLKNVFGVPDLTICLIHEVAKNSFASLRRKDLSNLSWFCFRKRPIWNFSASYFIFRIRAKTSKRTLSISMNKSDTLCQG